MKNYPKPLLISHCLISTTLTLTRAMDFTVIDSNQILRQNPKYGLRVILDG